MSILNLGDKLARQKNSGENNSIRPINYNKISNNGEEF